MVFMGIVCMFFMHIVSFKIIILISIKRSVLRFVSMLFLIFEKGVSKKTVPDILRFVSMLFNLIINVIIVSIKRVIVVFGVCMYAFYECCYF